jgi:hypothetical protein
MKKTQTIAIIIVIFSFLTGCTSKDLVTHIDHEAENTNHEVAITNTSSNINAIMAINEGFSFEPYAEYIGTPPSTKKTLILNQFKRNSSLRIIKDIPSSKRNPTIKKKTPLLLSLQSELTTLTHESTSHTFDVYNFSSGEEPIKIEATLRYGTPTSKCLIFVETSIGNSLTASGSTWENIGKKIDEKCERLTSLIGNHYDVDNNDAFIILVYPINSNDSSGSLAGYFFPNDIIPDETYYSNQMDMVYVDSDATSETSFIETIIHEYVHLIAFSIRRIPNFNDQNKDLNTLETWINEGIAEALTHYALDTPIQSLKDSMKYASEIRNGKFSPIIWEDSYYNYVLTYTFLQYTRAQSEKGYPYFNDIIRSQYNDYRSITTILNLPLMTIIKNYHIANIINQKTGPYGYKSDSDFIDLKELNAPTHDDIYLIPGAAVYFYPSLDEFNNYTNDDSSENIYYYKIDAKNN